jgi:hypothetical protein
MRARARLPPSPGRDSITYGHHCVHSCGDTSASKIRSTGAAISHSVTSE